ncbi:MAG: V/A-type H+/Na+-transporting ATPase subunit [Thermoplasmata archaeon]|jgi:V/A-type H+-transporting ATPase subunit F|nr:V/A-type H+/Na+-transporting ATPase subunit [Thermoplasmata archaeon]HUR62983.1 V-type ATP synthase subunit F [Candidatus Thermoplasmatota archaeon]
MGSPQFTLGFRLAGVRRIWDAVSEEELERAARLATSDAAVSILVLETADLARLSPRTRADLVASVKPTVVAVGTQEDNTLREKIKQAVGVDLW